VLPSDVSAIKIANRLLGGIFVFSILSSGILANLFLGLYVESGYTDIPRLQRGCFQATVMLICLIHFVRVIMAAFLPPRSRLDQLWRVLAQFLFLNGVVWFVTAVLRVFPDWCNPSFYTFAIYLLANGAIIGWPNFRVRAQAFLSSRGGTHMAAGIAAAIGNNSVEDAQKKAGKLLRYVTLDKVNKDDLAENKPNPLLYERSVQGRIGEIDAFLSHSWHDPSDDKWDGLQAWRKRFKSRHGREPRIWFDKFCINQLDIDDSLMCLPVHLAACKKFVMIVGSTYASRIWCIMEIFVFLAAVNDMSRLECIPIAFPPATSGNDRKLNGQTKASSVPAAPATDAASKAEVAGEATAESDVLQTFRRFTVGECQCFSQDEKDKLLTIIEAGCGTLDDFDALIRAMQITFTKAEDVSTRSKLGGIANLKRQVTR